MAVGSFTSASLDPPLVAFFPDRSSTSWPKIKAAGRFCVNILSDEQEVICRRSAFHHACSSSIYIRRGHRSAALGGAARPEMERLADSLPARCIATVRVKDELVIAASAGRSTHGTTPTLVGQRLPFMPPSGSVLAAWSGKADVADWLLAASNGSQRKSFEESLQAVRSRGYSIGLVNDAQRVFVSTLERACGQGGRRS
jgi:flavin reductase like protein